MGKGVLRIQVVAAEGAILIEGAAISLMDESGETLFNITTDRTGHAPDVALNAPDIALTEDPFATQRRYSVYSVRVAAAGYRTITYNGIMIFDDTTSLLVVEMHPNLQRFGGTEEFVDVGGHALDSPEMPEPQQSAPMPRVLANVVIPNFIRVHLGRPAVAAPVVRVPFIDYIKNVTYTKHRTTRNALSIKDCITCPL